VYEKPEDIIDLIQDAIRDDIKNGNLAFLLLTSKSEHYIRDKVALRLYRTPSLKRFLVSREWWGKEKGKEKIDLAILGKKNKPKVLIEFKLRNVLASIGNVGGEIKNDFDKLKVWQEAHRFIVLMSLLPHKPIDKRFKDIVKYYRDFNRQDIQNYRILFKKGSTEVHRLIGVLDNKIIGNLREYKFSIGSFYNDTNLELIFWVFNVK
jgi:hypothetical protein